MDVQMGNLSGQLGVGAILNNMWTGIVKINVLYVH